MSEILRSVEKEIAIVNRLGLHARAATMFVQVANRFLSEVWVAKDDIEVDGKSILGLLMLGANQGSKLRIRIDGPDAPEAMREIEGLIQSRLDEAQL
jgi:phosphocarrier protein HPr